MQVASGPVLPRLRVKREERPSETHVFRDLPSHGYTDALSAPLAECPGSGRYRQCIVQIDCTVGTESGSAKESPQCADASGCPD